MGNREKLIDFYHQLDRSYFMNKYKDLASQDTPFPIGHGQTISQPSLVLKMTLLLDVKEDSRVLEIGTGSGYQTALLAKVSKEVYTVERIEELYLEAKERLDKKEFNNIKFKLGDGSLGWKENSPYDRIMVTASAKILPEEILNQLSPGGKMVIPVGRGSVQDLMITDKDLNGKIEKELVEKVRFVRLIQEE